MSPRVASGRVRWFNLEKKFGFVELCEGLGDAFLHISVLKAAGYAAVPAGTMLRVRVVPEQRRQRVVEVLSVDTSTARPGEPPAVVRKAPADKIGPITSASGSPGQKDPGGPTSESRDRVMVSSRLR